jgi:dolichyl-phosphate beta-glucosyltransferase
LDLHIHPSGAVISALTDVSGTGSVFQLVEPEGRTPDTCFEEKPVMMLNNVAQDHPNQTLDRRVIWQVALSSGSILRIELGAWFSISWIDSFRSTMARPFADIKLKDIAYSIVIPAYNEGVRLGATLEKVLGYVRAQGWNAEVIVVNDGSSDNTAELVLGFAARDTVLRLVENPGNRGKGYAVCNGMLNARGKVVVFSDADMSSPIEEMPKLLAALAAGADIAIGSRWLRSELQTQRQSLHRQLFGRVFNLLLRTILGLRFKDTQCGFKAFARRAAQTILPLQRIERWGFDPEILFLARKLGFHAEEVPVFWGHSGDTRIHPLVDGVRMFWEMLRIRWYDFTGKYEGGTVATHPLKTPPGGPSPHA